MPATRSGRSNTKGKEPAVYSRPSMVDDDVIVISSDDEAPDSTTIALRKAKEEVRILKKQLLAKEVSSSQVLSEQGNHRVHGGNSSVRRKKSVDDEQHRLETQLNQANTDIHKLQSALRQEKETRTRESLRIEKLRKRADAAELENTNLKTLNQELLNRASGSNDTKNLHELEDHILCEICQDRLWHPCTITECGHTLCQGCLTDWFNTAIAANVHQPRYECPKCRTRVFRKPIEDFTLKSIVRAISHAIDPANGSPPAPPRYHTGHGPWYRFFGQ